MSECKLCALTVASMEEPSSSESTISKKRKTTATANSSSFQSQLHSSDKETVSPEASVNSDGTVVIAEFCSDRSCCSSSYVKGLHTAPLDLQVWFSRFRIIINCLTFVNFPSCLSKFSWIPIIPCSFFFLLEFLCLIKLFCFFFLYLFIDIR